jgi:hypothetical protein
MRAWTVDAGDIRVTEGFDASLLHRTSEIDSFLSPDRDDKFIVVAAKGSGKTPLLKAKRVLYQRKVAWSARRPGTCSTSRSATRSSGAKPSRSSPHPRSRGRSCGSRPSRSPP